jgi:hypothetical protein
MVESLLGGGELPRTIMNRIEWNDIGGGSVRHDRGEEEMIG